MGRKEVDARDLFLGQPGDVTMANGELHTGRNILTVAEKAALNPDYMAELAFMEELMEIMVHEAADENAENPVCIGNNGIFVQFYRGVPTITRRKFVDCLIVKQEKITTPESTTANGERVRLIKRHAALKYPFSVLEDKNPKGAEWLRRRMADVL